MRLDWNAHLKYCCAVLVLLLCSLLPAFASVAADLVTDLSQTDLPISLEAEHLDFDRQNGVYRAEGDVHLNSGPIRLRAHKVDYEVASGQAFASGQVVVETPEGTLRGEIVSFNLNTGLGRIDKGELFLKQSNFYLAGDYIERLEASRYHVRKGTFTVCDAADPAWKFTARDLDIDVEGYAKGYHSLFYLGGIPSFYLPYMLYPVKQERKSGLLFPEFGFSEKRGIELGLAWYWAIARNQDMTFYLDLLTELGVGQGIEYRYLLGDDNNGELLGYRISGLKGADDRYALTWKHSGSLPKQTHLAADVEYVSSRDYFEDFGRVADDYTKERATSVISLSKHWESTNLSGQLMYVQDLEQNNSETLQRLPEIHYDLLRSRHEATGIDYGLESSVTHFWRNRGVRGGRLAVRPFIATVFQPWSLLEIEPELGYTFRGYALENGEEGSPAAGISDFTTRISTRLAKVYRPEWRGVEKLRHSIEPDIKYRYVPEISQTSLPDFDDLDQIEPANLISYGLTNRLTVKRSNEDGSPVYHEYLYARLSQEFDIAESRRDPLDPTDSRKPFSSIRLEMIARPNEDLTFNLDARYDPNQGAREFTTFNANGSWHDQKGNSVNLDYRFTRDFTEYLSGEVELAWFDPIYMKYLQRYDFQDQQNLEQAFKLEYRAQCWNLALVVRDRLEDSEYLLTFSLSGIGQLARFGGNLGTSSTTTP